MRSITDLFQKLCIYILTIACQHVDDDIELEGDVLLRESKLIAIKYKYKYKN